MEDAGGEAEEWKPSENQRDRPISSCSGYLNGTSYEWRIYPGEFFEASSDEGYFVEEVRRMNPFYTKLFVYPMILQSLLVLCGISPVGGAVPQVAIISIDLPIYFEYSIHAILASVMLISFITVEKVILNTIEKDSYVEDSSNSPLIGLILAYFATVAIFGFYVLFEPLPGYIFSLFLVCFIGLCFTFVLKPIEVEKWYIESISVIEIEISPKIVVSYIVSVLFTVIAFIAGIATTFITDSLSAIIIMYLTGSVVWAALADLGADTQKISYLEFVENRSIKPGEPHLRREKYALLALTAFISLMAVLAIIAYYLFIPVENSIFLAFAPIYVFGIFILGFLSQIYSTLKLYFRVLTSRPLNRDISIDVDAKLRVSDSVGVATAVSTPTSDYILIPSQLAKDLDKGALSAMIAHEEAHISNGDTRFALHLNVLSPLLLIGVNVLYTMFDFSSRELQADRQAVERVGKNELITALEKSDEAVNSENGLSPGPSFLPFVKLGSEEDSEDLLAEFFGSFGLSHAHPPTEERKEYLRDL